MKKILLILGLFLSVSLLANEAEFYKPSFSCNNVKKESVEYKICTDKELANLDKQLNDIWKSFYVITRELKKEQRQWLKKRNRCKTKACIKQTYQNRVATLKQRLGNQKTFPQTILDILKKSQEAKKTTSVMIQKQQSEIFLKDLMLFRNIKMNNPILQQVNYDNPKLKKLLGQNCWNMRLDFKISLEENYTHFKRYEAHQMEKFSLWNVDMDGDGHNELILAKYGTNTYQYDLIEKNYCKKFKAIPYTDVCLQNMRKNYSDVWYDFFNTQNQLIHPYCTLEQKIVGFFSHNSNMEKGIKEKVLVINWKGKSCLLHIIYSSDRISLVLYGNKKLEFFCQQNYILDEKEK